MTSSHRGDEGAAQRVDIEDGNLFAGRFPLAAILISELVCSAAIVAAVFLS